MTDLRDRIAAVLYHSFDKLHSENTEVLADAVMELITVHIPPIVASAIHAYADSELMAMKYHGDPAGLASMEKLNREAAQIANYATTHENWNGAK